MGVLALLVVANLVAFVVYKQLRGRDALHLLRITFIVALVCSAVLLVEAGEARGGLQVLLVAPAAQQLWWGRRELRADPNKPAEPVPVASFSAAVLMLGSVAGIGLFALPDPRGFIALALAGVFGLYWVRTRAWPHWDEPSGSLGR